MSADNLARTVRIHQRIARAQQNQRFRKLKDFFKKQNPTLRYFTFLLLCIALNVTGIVLTQQSAASMFYFDSIGTALASLIGGFAAGMITAFSSSIISANIIDLPSYAYFGFSNALAAMAWAILPRLGNNALGADLLHPTEVNGYQRLITRVFVLGTCVGVIVSIASFLVQISFLDVQIDTKSKIMSVISDRTVVSKNNFILVAAIASNVDLSIFSENSILLVPISLLTAHVPDKIIATCTAAVLTMGFLRVPRINKQLILIRDNNISTKQFFNKDVMYFIFVALFISYYFLFLNSYKLSAIIFVGIFIFFVSTARLARKSITRVADPYGSQPQNNQAFYAKHMVREPMSFQKDVLEDTIKFLTITFTISQFLASRSIQQLRLTEESTLTSKLLTLNIDGENINFLIPTIFYIISFNIIILTGFRYFLVMLTRYTGKF